jgi:glycosyltransferase involved in cell wall biosynthesis
MNPFVTVIVPCYNEEKFIRPLLDNILEQDYPAEQLEVFVVDGASTDRTQEIIGEYHRQHPHIRMLVNERRFVSYALNLGIRMSKGNVIVRMDAHSEYPNDYVSVLVRNLFELKAENVGGRWITKPGDGSVKALAIAAAQSSVFGIGDAMYRIGVDKITRVDTVPFGCFHRSIFDRIGFFDEELFRNQDDEFNARITQSGGAIYLIPGVDIIYYARRTVYSLLKMFYQYSFFKPLVNRKLKRPATVRQFVPPLFVLFLLTGWLTAFISPALFYLYLGGAGIYLAADLVFSAKASRDARRWSLFVYLPWVFFLQHFIYGWGYLVGVVNFLLLRRSPPKVSSTR